MNKKEVTLGILMVVSLLCAFHIGISVGEIRYQNTDNSKAFVFGYVAGTRTTTTRIYIHQRDGTVFLPELIPQIILDASKRNSTLKGFHEDMAALDSLNLGLYPEMK